MPKGREHNCMQLLLEKSRIKVFLGLLSDLVLLVAASVAH